jgi:oxalate decarboxylase
LSRRELFTVASSTAAIAAASLALPKEIHAAPPQEHKKHAPLEGFKYDIEASDGRVTAGGSAKEANVDEFPISESMAGVSMRLNPGADCWNCTGMRSRGSGRSCSKAMYAPP